MKTHDPSQKSIATQERANEPWEPWEDRLLFAEYHSHRTTTEMTQVHKRSVEDICRRLDKLIPQNRV